MATKTRRVRTVRDQVVDLATQHGYLLEQEQANIALLIFTKGAVQVNVYHTTMTVGTVLEHPKQGKTQLFRPNVCLEELAKIFHNPRLHTGKGYYRRR